MIEADAEVLHQRDLAALLVVERNHLLENREIARLLEVRDRAEDEPHRIVIETATDVVVAALGERLVLMVAAAVRELGRRDVENALTGTLGDLMDESDEILVRVTETHAASDARLEERRRPRQIEGDHALVLVPDVDHAVQPFVARLDRVDRQKIVPIGLERLERLVDLLRRIKGLENRLRGLLVDHTLLLPLLLLRNFDVPEREDEVLRFAGLERQVHVVRGDRTPAVRDGIGTLAGRHDLRLIEAVVQSEERLAVRVKAVDLLIDTVERVMVAPLLVLGLVIDRRALDLHLASGEVALEVLHVRRGVPETPFDEREELHLLRLLRRVGQRQLQHLRVRLERHEHEERRGESVLLAVDLRVAHAVTARVGVELRLAGLPTGIPHGLSVLDVEIHAARIHRHAIVTIARDAAELRILEEGVATCRVRDKREEVLVAEIVDPRPRRLRVGDHVFAVRVVKISEFHSW